MNRISSFYEHPAGHMVKVVAYHYTEIQKSLAKEKWHKETERLKHINKINLDRLKMPC